MKDHDLPGNGKRKIIWEPAAFSLLCFVSTEVGSTVADLFGTKATEPPPCPPTHPPTLFSGDSLDPALPDSALAKLG